MLFLRSLRQSFRSLEWIFLTAHLGMWLSLTGYNLPAVSGFCGIIFLLSWIFPDRRPQWQRQLYIFLGQFTLLWARCSGIDLGLFLYIYFAKSYFLLGHRKTIALILITSIPWTISEYVGTLSVQQRIPSNPLGLNPSNPLRFAIFTLAVYIAASSFTVMFTGMLVREQKSDQKIEELSEEVESLIATLERTRIAREIHDSLGHTLTDLDTQLAVAQTLRSRNPTQAFQAVDTAKFLARQCIEDVSQVLNRMRQSDFDLNQALIALLEQLQHTSKLHVQWKVNLPSLPIYQSYQIYCIIKEGLINVQKHAQASQVSCFAHQTIEGITLELIDDGVGFDGKAFNPGFGIQGMIERVQLLGGQFDIQSVCAQGTQIFVTLPL
jgi:signal transduction histidine kinase